MALDRTRWDIVGLALTAGYIAGLQVGKVPPALPMLQEELALARVSAGLAGAAAHAPGQAQVAMASGFVVQGAALGSVLGPPLLAVVTSVFGGWEAAWWTMLVGPGLGLWAAVVLKGAERRLERGADASR